MAFALGAIVSPTDPVAATSIVRRLGAPRRIVNLIEGESLVNDATALVAYRVAVARCGRGQLLRLDAGVEFVVDGSRRGRVGSWSAWSSSRDPPARWKTRRPRSRSR